MLYPKLIADNRLKVSFRLSKTMVSFNLSTPF